MQAHIAPPPIYVAASTCNLLLSFLDQEQLAVPELRDKLKRLVQGPRIPIASWWIVLQEIQLSHPLPALGLAIGSCAKPHHIGVLGYLALYSETLGQALFRFSRFQPLIHNLAPSLFFQQGDNLVLSWGKAEQASTRLSDDIVMSSLIAFARSLTGCSTLAPCLIESVHSLPADSALYSQYYGCPVHFGSAHAAMHVPLAQLNLPINTRDPHLTCLLEQQAETLLNALPEPSSLISELQQHIVAILQDGPPNLTAVAERMGLPERTLYRALKARGLSYKGILNALRYELTKDYLRNPQLSLLEITLLLGYAEQSVFSRAFKAWSGETPMRWRRNVIDPSHAV